MPLLHAEDRCLLTVQIEEAIVRRKLRDSPITPEEASFLASCSVSRYAAVHAATAVHSAAEGQDVRMRLSASAQLRPDRTAAPTTRAATLAASRWLLEHHQRHCRQGHHPGARTLRLSCSWQTPAPQPHSRLSGPLGLRCTACCTGAPPCMDHAHHNVLSMRTAMCSGYHEQPG